MSRGNRQGNNSFLEYKDNKTNPIDYMTDKHFIKRIFSSSGMEVETLNALWKLSDDTETSYNANIYIAVRAGNYKIA
jgi:hypothetical protein